MKFKVFLVFIFLLLLIQNSNSESNLTKVDDIFYIGKMESYNKDFTFHRYDGAGHGFIYYDRPIYRQEQAVDAWEKIIEFLNDKLRG